MPIVSRNKRFILGFALILSFLPIKSQIKPEVTLGLRYNSDILFRTTHDNHPLAMEIGGGINYNKKWYTGVNADYFRTKSSITDSKHYLIELELRRSFKLVQLPKFVFNLSFRPGLILVDAYSFSSSTQLDLYKTLAISISTGVAYSFSNHFKISVWPGFAWLPQESSRITDKQKIGFFCGTGLSYKF